MESLLLQATWYLGAAIVIVPLTVRAGLGSVLGYLMAGLLLGPALGLTGAETDDLRHFAEFGVVVMLFLIGLELNPRTLWEMRSRLLGLGGLQVLLTASAIAAILLLIGEDWRVAITLGGALALSSTAIVLQTLSEKNLLRTPGGRSSFAVLLAQDIAVVPMLALIPLLATRKVADAHADVGAAEPLLTLVESLPGWAVTGITLGIVAAIILAGHFLSGPVFRFVHAARLPEMSTFISLLIVIGIAFLMMLVGLSPALGTFIGGVVLANSEFRHQIEVELKPFKGILMGLFFMTVGASINLLEFAEQPLRLFALTITLMMAKAAILVGLATVFGLRGRDRSLFAFSLAQGGEFGFLIVSFSVTQAILPQDQAQRALLVISMSMLLTPLLFVAQERLARWQAKRQTEAPPDEIDERGAVIIAGIGRFGQVVNRMVRSAGMQTVVLDSDPTAIARMARFGIRSFYGDPSRHDLLLGAGLMEAQVLVVAVDLPENITKIVQFARKVRPDIHIVARAYDRVHVFELYRAGADDIVRETFDSSVRAGRYVLENMGLTDYEAAKLSQTYFRVDRAAMRELAELWEPGKPVHLNDAYVARARQLDDDLRTAMLDDPDEGAASKAAQ